MAVNVIKIPLVNKIISLRYDDSVLDEIDIDDTVNIDYSNIVGELLTFSVIMNRIGILKAEAWNAYQNKKLELEIYRARCAEESRKRLTTVKIDEGGRGRDAKPTKDEVENAVILDSVYQSKLRGVYRAEKDHANIESLYWAAKSKDDKLNVFGKSLTPEDMERDLVDKVVNNISIKGHSKPFRNERGH
ncbi:hypothetical protein EOM86_03555 [Candidatus Nomurabacteria bacterium]|nr:hypothetical protein [Candidatus Nomurabacteria bacterium]